MGKSIYYPQQDCRSCHINPMLGPFKADITWFGKDKFAKKEMNFFPKGK